MMPRNAVLAVLALVTLGACSPVGAGSGASRGTNGPNGPNAVDLSIYAAASLKGALERARSAYASAGSSTTLTLATDSSAALATQIEEGAPADVFLSADATNAQQLIDAGLADGDVVTFARNELTIIVPTANPAAIRSPADLARPGVVVIAAGDAVPITRYATRLVANLATVVGYPADFAPAYAANVASREDNVKAVVAKIELGEGDAGIVYATDARASTKVATIAIPEAANVSAKYDGIVIRTSRQAAAAMAFLDWFAGPGGQAVLGDLGFLPPS